MYKQCQRCLTGDDALRLKLYLIENLSVRFLSSLAYEAACHGSYQCLELIMKHQNFDAYFTIPADGSNLPLLHHTIRLGDLHACKLLLDHGVHPLVCAGFCEQSGSVDEEKDECEDAVRYSLHAASTSNRRNTIAVLLQTHLCECLHSCILSPNVALKLNALF
ncbi:uncharacterized protein DEA37_0009055 [Paragonimus westermani]|uniref:Uncharacterized protein n=1 Tax=Paragonimus westermani TaxID=34504 RepID=A0A5J4NYR0_9TREM|nr:uncharacterized protein DEA37_0009055 [Paragonimus westermani]